MPGSGKEQRPVKTYPTIACCGLDCGLCPRYHTTGTSKCPGCCGPEFFNKHPSCSFITCCVKNKGLEVCAECKEFPCPKFKNAGSCDSFVTYGKVVYNLNFIKQHGIKKFITQQQKRIELLGTMLKDFDDGRSKSFYCLAATLLPIDVLKKALKNSEQTIQKTDDIKLSAKILKDLLTEFAVKEGTELKLRSKK